MSARHELVLLYGGRSGEHEISLQSAASVLAHLDTRRYEVRPVSIDKQGVWRLQDATRLRAAGGVALPIFEDAPAVCLLPGRGVLVDEEGATHGVDAVFPVVHGPLCEDGSLQGLLELADLPYVGAGVLGSAVAMDKDVAKRLVAAEGVATPKHVALRSTDWRSDRAGSLARVQRVLDFPVFVKPANLGSSVGISRASDAAGLAQAIEAALPYDDKVLVEQALRVREIELAVLDGTATGEQPQVSVPGEIIPRREFYSYQAKYLDDEGARLVVPAELDATQRAQAQALARRIFVTLECEGMARVDLFLEPATGRFFFNELNTIPGFTRISMYPKLWEASGVAYSDLLDRLITQALARHARRRSLRRDWRVG